MNIRKIKNIFLYTIIFALFACHHNFSVQPIKIDSNYCNREIPEIDSFELSTKQNVKIKSFYVCDHEVTQGEWQYVMGNLNNFVKNDKNGKGANYPVYNISWFDAVKFCNALSKTQNLEPAYTINGKNVSWNKDAKGYRLLTSAEWEYVSCAGKTGNLPYSGAETTSDTNYSAFVWFEENKNGKAREVKGKNANAFGVYDMSGNVWEWCWDWFDENYSEVDNPTGPSTGTKKIFRGGGWKCPKSQVRARSMSTREPTKSWYLLGFRVACSK